VDDYRLEKEAQDGERLSICFELTWIQYLLTSLESSVPQLPKNLIEIYPYCLADGF